MRVLIAGGRGFLGTALRRELISYGHSVRILTRSRARSEDAVTWDGLNSGAWTESLEQTDAVVNACGYGLEHWPWTSARKQLFLESRTLPGRALASALRGVKRRPSKFIQFSGINRYGLGGETAADEASPVGSDFLAQLTIAWEDSTLTIEDLGVRRVIVRNAVVLDRREGLFPLMCLPARSFLGGCLGSGQQSVPWIHIRDYTRAVRFLLETDDARGAFNLVAPTPASNVELMQAVCAALKRPYWTRIPALALRLALGEMAVLVLRGRPSIPRALLDAGFEFEFAAIRSATQDLLSA